MTSQNIANTPIASNDFVQVHQATQEHDMNDLNTATPSPVHDLQNSPPRDNFPLPPELRNHIYSYLLDAEYTRVSRDSVGDPAYKFHTNILGVNRQIHYEAEQYLCKRNVFVVVSHQFSSGNFETMMSAAPWVSTLGEREFKHRLLSVHLSEVPHGHSRQSKIPRSRWLFLSADLEHYAQFAALLLADRIYYAPLLVLKSDGELQDRFVNRKGRERSLDHLRLEFHSHLHRKATTETQASLLASLRPLQCPNVLISIGGEVLDQDSARDLEPSKGSSLVCNAAKNWHFLEVWDRMQALVNASMIDDEPDHAAHIFGEVSARAERCKRIHSWHSHDIRRALSRFRWAMAHGRIFAHWSMQDPFGFAKAVSDLLRAVGQYVSNSEASSNLFHLHMLAKVLSPSEASLPPFPHITVAECIQRLPISRPDSRRHDVAILKRCADQDKIFTPDDLPAASCSFFAKRVTGPGFDRLVKKPDHMSGFLDLHQLRDLDKGKKEQINKLQVECGLSITRFEDYNETDSRSGAV